MNVTAYNPADNFPQNDASDLYSVFFNYYSMSAGGIKCFAIAITSVCPSDTLGNYIKTT